MATQEQELSALRKLNRLVEERDSAIEKRDHCKQSLNEIEYKIDTARFRKEDMNYYELAVRDAWREIEEMRSGAEKKAKNTLVGVFCIVLGLSLAIGMAKIDAKHMMSFLSLWVVIILPLSILVARRIFTVAKKRSVFKYSLKDYAEKLAQAKKQDETNATRNLINKQEAQREKRRELQPEIDRLRQERERAEKVIAGKTYEIEQMNLLTEADLEHIDYIIDRITSHRADTIKEALRQLDDQLDKQERERREIARRNLDRFLAEEKWRREQERQERELENWRDEQRRRADREYERREEHRTNVENTLDEISKKLDE